MADVTLKHNASLEQWLDQVLRSEAYVKVGIVAKPDGESLWNAGSPKLSEGADGKRTLSYGTGLLDVAVFHEFGTSRVPERSFLRSTFDRDSHKLGRAYEEAIKNQLGDGTDAKLSIEKAHKFVGAWFASRVKWTFTNNNWRPLKDPTRGGRNALGKATPLVDTGQLRAAIGYEIVIPEGAL